MLKELKARYKKKKNMKAIVDCNSFYCSCERVFRPDLAEKPVVVLSNNDGCIISISDEAKKLGVTMASPYFKMKKFIAENGIETFSSNYNLYGDMSRRVMDTLKAIIGKENVEVYSVDEAFLCMDEVRPEALQSFAKHIKDTVEQWTGIKVSVGVATTKVLSKVANRLSKKNKIATQGVMILNTPEKVTDALCKTQVSDVWGVGRKNAEKLIKFGIEDAYQLSNMNEEWARKNLGGVVGVRLIKELKGTPAIMMEDELVNKKMIASTRMFGSPVTSMQDIKEAVATYTSRAAEKLRRQQSAAGVITVFVVPKEEMLAHEHFRHGPTVSAHVTLPKATSITNDLIKPAMQLVEQIYKQGNLYKKAGVILSAIVPDATIQGNLFASEASNNKRMLMHMIDNINFSMRDDALKFASSGTERNWKMRQELRSPRFTSRWNELCEVK